MRRTVGLVTLVLVLAGMLLAAPVLGHHKPWHSGGPASPTATPTPEPTPTPTPDAAPIRAYYYLWWSANHWRDKLGPNYPYTASPWPLPATTDSGGCNATTLYDGNQLLDVPASLYSQDDPGVIEGHIRAAKDAGLAGFLLNWSGNGRTDQTMSSVTYTKRLAEAFAASGRVGGFTNWISYKAASHPSPTAIINDARYLLATFGSDPTWERRNGKPVFVFTGSRKYTDAEVEQVVTALRSSLYLVGDENNATLTSTRLANWEAVTYYWSTQRPSSSSFTTIKSMGDRVHAAGKEWYPPFTPGYSGQLLTGGSCIPRGTTMVDLYTGNLASKPDAWALISWNEIAENTHVEPLQKWGTRWLDVLRGVVTPEG